MKIFVVDDSLKHLEAARTQLGTEHELTTFEEYGELLQALKEETPDVLLSDLRMPGEAMTLGSEGMKEFGKPFDAGMFLTFVAARKGIARMAVVTDLNHHNHPASAMIDNINPAYWGGRERCFQLEGTKVLIAHAPLKEDGTKDWKAVLDVLLAA